MIGPSTGLSTGSRPFDAYDNFIEAEGHESFDKLRTLRLSKGKRKGHPRMWCAPERVEWLPSPPEAETADPVVNPPEADYAC